MPSALGCAGAGKRATRERGLRRGNTEGAGRRRGGRGDEHLLLRCARAQRSHGPDSRTPTHA
eukprot:4851642-Pyramimonas_sp.AAC.2